MTQELLDDLTIHWQDAAKKGGNPFGMLPKPEMLLPGGLTLQRKFTKLGRGSLPDKTIIWVNVRYDRDYVVAWLRTRLLTSLDGIPYNELQKLLSSAMSAHKANNKRGEKDESEKLR